MLILVLYSYIGPAALVLFLIALSLTVDSGTDGFGNLMDPTTNLETNLESLISEVYANNQQELAPCLDGLGAEEAMQQQEQQDQQQSNFSAATPSAAFSTHISFPGPGSSGKSKTSMAFRQKRRLLAPELSRRIDQYGLGSFAELLGHG